MTDNYIGNEGAKSFGKMLKVNTSLVSLSLGSEKQTKKETEKKVK